jgi:hypothetical protein
LLSATDHVSTTEPPHSPCKLTTLARQNSQKPQQKPRPTTRKKNCKKKPKNSDGLETV